VGGEFLRGLAILGLLPSSRCAPSRRKAPGGHPRFWPCSSLAWFSQLAEVERARVPEHRLYLYLVFWMLWIEHLHESARSIRALNERPTTTVAIGFVPFPLDLNAVRLHPYLKRHVPSVVYDLQGVVVVVPIPRGGRSLYAPLVSSEFGDQPSRSIVDCCRHPNLSAETLDHQFSVFAELEDWRAFRSDLDEDGAGISNFQLPNEYSLRGNGRCRFQNSSIAWDGRWRDLPNHDKRNDPYKQGQSSRGRVDCNARIAHRDCDNGTKQQKDESSNEVCCIPTR
jgi:hypothetical protein